MSVDKTDTSKANDKELGAQAEKIRIIAGYDEGNQEVQEAKLHKGYLDDDLYFSQVARGFITGAKIFYAYGKITTGGAANKWIINPVTSLTTPLYTGATGIQMQIQSTSAEDGAGTQTGILEVEIHYIDNNGDEANETITLNGTTPVTTTATDIRFIQCMHLTDVGSASSAVGTITLTNVGATTTYSTILVGDNRCSSSMRYVPNGKRLLIKALLGSSTSITADTTGNITFVSTNIEGHDLTAKGILFPQMEIGSQNGSEALPSDFALAVPGNTIVGFTTTTNKAATVTAGFIGVIENV